MKKKIGIGKSHSKLILMGEHAVVYGYPAIAIPLKSIEVTCWVEASDHLLIKNAQDPLSVAIFTALDHLKQEAYITYRVNSTVPERRGLGSSAAVAIAAIRAVFDYFNCPLSEPLLDKLASKAEEVAHYNPSGLDVKTCLADSAIHFVRGQGFSNLHFDLNAYLVIADTGVHGHTKEAVEKVKNLGQSARENLDLLGALTLKAEASLLKGDVLGLGRGMTQAHQGLSDLGVSCPEADNLVRQALEYGALGSKMTGGGLGGCIISLVKTESEAENLAKKLEEKGARNTWIQRL